MKNLVQVFYILSLTFIIACSSDGPDKISVPNQFVVNDETYDIMGTGFIDLGDLQGIPVTTSQGSFALSDKSISISASKTFSVQRNNSILVILTFISSGAGGLSSGDYKKGDNLSVGRGKFFIAQSISVKGMNYTVDSGTVTLQGSSPNFTLKFDLMLKDGSKLTGLTGGFSGTFVTT